MTILSNAQLAELAGVDPWVLHAKIAVADPAQVESLAAAFYKAGGNMAQANTDQQRSATYRRQGYSADGTSPIDFDAEAKATVAAPENLKQIGKILDGVATDLSGAMSTAESEVSTLEQELSAIETRWTTFMQSIGHHLPPDDQAAERQGLIDEAVTRVKAHGSIIDASIKKYEETIFGAQKSMSDLGYVPPATLDDLYGDGAEYVKQLQETAKAAADKLKNNHSLDENWAKAAHEVAGEVAPYMNDPYFASAFYGELGPQMTQMLPSLMYESGSHTTAADLRTYSHMFGTAVTNAGKDSHMQDVADSFLHTPQEAATSWNRGAMVSNGDFPPDWLAKAARYNALDTFADKGAEGFGMGWQGTPNGSEAYDMGLSSDALALWTKDLGQNPVAAREALATMGNGHPDDVRIPADPSAAYHTNIHKLMEYGEQNGYPGDVSDAYGSAFAAASGANDEHDGAHSADAVAFTKALFNDMHDDNGLSQPNAAHYMAKIAGSYVQELAAGNDLEGTSVGGVDAHGLVPGDHAAFGVPPELAKEFMKTFAGNAEATQIFDSAAGEAAHHAMLAGAQQDTVLLHDGKSAYGFNTAAQAYGSVAGSENGAAIQVVGKQVEDEEHAQESMRKLLSWGVDLIPGGKIAEDVGGLVAKAPDTLWDIAKHVSNIGLEHEYGAAPGSAEQLAHFKDASYESAMASDYERTAILHDAGYPGTDHIPDELLTSDGHMVDAATVMKNEQLREAYYAYMHEGANAPQGSLGHGASVYEVTKNASGRFAAAYQGAKGNDEGVSE
ncbi:MAG: hypothetical protein QOC66_3378 [Pseudonocardiales bacterium]|nr:hypothetical protein [Pseudonocardiales bacterium]